MEFDTIAQPGTVSKSPVLGSNLTETKQARASPGPVGSPMPHMISPLGYESKYFSIPVTDFSTIDDPNHEPDLTGSHGHAILPYDQFYSEVLSDSSRRDMEADHRVCLQPCVSIFVSPGASHN